MKLKRYEFGERREPRDTLPELMFDKDVDEEIARFDGDELVISLGDTPKNLTKTGEAFLTLSFKELQSLNNVYDRWLHRAAIERN